MGKAKKEDPFDPHNLSPQGQLRLEIARELGLESKVIEGGQGGPMVRENGKIGGLITERKRETKQEALQQD